MVWVTQNNTGQLQLCLIPVLLHLTKPLFKQKLTLSGVLSELFFTRKTVRLGLAEGNKGIAVDI